MCGLASPAQVGGTMLPYRPNLVEIVDHQLNFLKYVDAVRHPGAGAISTFHGTTRDTFEGQRVLELQYEAYGPMARAELEKICEQARESWSVTGVAVAHRIGVVPVGEESVFVAVSSVHRKDALAACQFVIDELKASTPIWKKEVYEGGAVWKQNSEFKLGQRRRCCHKPDQRNVLDTVSNEQQERTLGQTASEQSTEALD